MLPEVVCSSARRAMWAKPLAGVADLT